MGKRFLLADDSDVAMQSLRGLVSSRSGWTICAEASDGLKAVEMAARTQPDVAILDLQMPGISGADAARQIVTVLPSVLVLLVSSHDPALVVPAIQSTPIRGFVSKDSLDSQLLPAIESILAGHSYFGNTEKLQDRAEGNSEKAEAEN